MKNYIKYIIVALAAVFVSTGCAKFDEMNKNP